MTDHFSLYKKALKSKYEQIKTGIYANYLYEPTPAKLRNLCAHLYAEENRSKDDLKVFEVFFGSEYNGSSTQFIKKHTEKFRPVQTFLLNETDISESNNAAADILAVLLDYEQRPYRKFIKQDESIDVKPSNIVQRPEESRQVVAEEIPKQEDVEILKTVTTPPPAFRYKMTAVIVVLGLIMFSIFNLTATEKQCMQWQNDHYEPLDCNTQHSEFTTQVIALDTSLLKFRQIFPSKNATFMSDGKITIWYCKDGGVDFFNSDGKHPLTGKNLGPASAHIIQKYGKDN